MTPYPLGRNREHDPRSRNYRFGIERAGARSVIHRLYAPTLDQGILGSCEGNTAAEWLNCGKALRNRKAFWRTKGTGSVRSYLSEAEAVELYSDATKLDEDGIATTYPPVDGGTTGVGVAKALQSCGAITEYRWTFTWDGFLAALQKQPVMLGTNWYDSMFEVNAYGYVVAPSPRANPVGGHAYLAFGVDWPKQRIACQNHWGTDWGVKIAGRPGRFWLNFTLLQRLLLREQGESLVPVLL